MIPTQETIVDLEALVTLQLEGGPRHRPSAQWRVAAGAWSEAVWAAARAAGPLAVHPGDVARGLALAAHPVFVCGVHRSGTTLVRDLLDGHRQLVVLPSEGSFYTSLQPHVSRLSSGDAQAFVCCEWLRRLANPINQPPYWLLGRTSAAPSPYVTFARAFISWWKVVQDEIPQVPSRPLAVLSLAYAYCSGGQSLEAGVKRWAEKTPTNERHLSRLLRDFPDARIIHVVRNPIDVLGSRKRLEETAHRRFDAGHVVDDLRMSYRVALRGVAGDRRARYLLVRYEELIACPAVVCQRLARFLEIEMSPTLLRPTVAGLPATSNSSFDVDPVAGHILAPTDRPSTLSSAELDLLSAVAGDAAAALGYAVTPLRTAKKWRLRLLRHLA